MNRVNFTVLLEPLLDKSVSLEYNDPERWLERACMRGREAYQTRIILSCEDINTR
jgi:hypothetical protein